MSRKLAVERVYNLSEWFGNYNTLRLTDEIEIPEELEWNSEYVEKVRALQFVNMEIDYIRYISLSTKPTKDFKESLARLDELKASIQDTIDKISAVLKGE